MTTTRRNRGSAWALSKTVRLETCEVCEQPLRKGREAYRRRIDIYACRACIERPTRRTA